MNRPRFTIGHLMLAILVIAVNAGLIRAFFLQGMFSGVILLFFAMQVGLFLLLHSKGRARCFWVGFGGAGIAVVLALFLCDLFEDSAFTRCVSLYQMLVETRWSNRLRCLLPSRSSSCTTQICSMRRCFSLRNS